MVNVAVNPGYDADIIIAGAGPAGAAAACHLRRLGASIILLDQACFPRDKVCGDFVGPAALVELDALGISQANGFAQTHIGHRGAFYVDGEELIVKTFPVIDGLPPYCRVIPRFILDNYIIQSARSAGAQVREGVRLTGFNVEPGAVTVIAASAYGQLTLRGRVLIGADGSASTVARLTRKGAPLRCDRLIASRAYFRNVEGPDDRLDVYFSSACFPGYCWLFPAGNGEANVGLGVPVETFPAYDRTPAAILDQMMRGDAALSRRLNNGRMHGKITGWPLIIFNHEQPVVFDRVVLIGDAAGLINPLNGEGIQYALMSARWASEILAPCLRDNDFSAPALAPFSKRVEDALRHDMALSRLILQFASNRALTPVCLGVMKRLASRARKDSNFADTLQGIFSGLIPTREAYKVIGGTIDEALQALVSGMVMTALKGPRHLARSGAAGVQLAFQFAYDTMRNPAAFAEWLKTTANGTIELGAQVSRNGARSETENDMAYRSPP